MNIQQTASHQGDSGKHAGMSRYLVTLIAVTAMLYLLPFLLLRLPGYRNWSNNFNFPVLDFGFQTAGQNDDIVIYGDSSADHDISPQKMGEALGMKVLLLPGNSSLLALTGDFPLRHYLAANKPPRLIILHFAPWSLDYEHTDFKTNPPYDGLEMLIRHGTPTEILHFAKVHPTPVAEFPLMFYSLNLPKLLTSKQNVRAQAAQVKETNGYTDFPGDENYNADCKLPSSLIKKIHFDSAKEMAKRLESPVTKVLIFVAPVPDCEGAQEVARLPYEQLPAVPPKIMPATSFAKDVYYTHLRPAAVPAATENLIQAARAALATPQN